MEDSEQNPLFITPPPGLIPSRPHKTEPPTETDSGTRRISPAARASVSPPPFFASPIGIIPAPSLLRAVVLPGGVRHPLAKSVLIGRNPSGSPEWHDAELLAVDDPAKTVSKTHAVLEVAGGRIWVRDLASTNGVRVHHPDGQTVEVESGDRIEVEPGDQISLGEFHVTIE